MAWVLGETVSESFEVGTTGQTFTRVASYINGSSSAFAPTFSDIGSGFYRYSYTPVVAGSFEWVGTATNGTPVTINFDVEGETVVVSAAVTAVGGSSLRMIRRDVSDLLGNMLLVTCTDAGLTSTAIDTAHLGGPNNAYAGREAYFAEGTLANLGLARFITSSTQSTKSIAFSAMPSATALGDVIEIHNVRMSGWTKDEIHRAINMALVDATQALWSKDREDIGTAFDQDTPTVTVPSSFYAIYGVHWQDDDGIWHEIDAAEGPNAYGWWLFQGERELVINGTPRSSADEHTIRVYGYKQYAALSADTDTTLVNAEWLRHQTCAYLCMQGRERIGDVSRERAYLQFQGRADRVRDLLSGPPEANTVLVL